MSQYQNHQTLYLMTQVLAAHEITKMEWLHSETGHGNAPADGVVAAIKRWADRYVAQGHSITTAVELMCIFSDSTIITKKVCYTITLFERAI